MSKEIKAMRKRLKSLIKKSKVMQKEQADAGAYPAAATLSTRIATLYEVLNVHLPKIEKAE